VRRVRASGRHHGSKPNKEVSTMAIGGGLLFIILLIVLLVILL
jgi:hypothetical protein